MPFVYHTPNFEIGTAATPDVEFPQLTWKPGSRSFSIVHMIVGGEAGYPFGTVVTSISGIAVRLKRWTTTPTVPTSILTMAPLDPGAQPAKLTAGLITPPTFTQGTGGPQYLGGMVVGNGSPAIWKARSPAHAPGLEGSANQSIDLVLASPTSSIFATADIFVQE